MFLYSPELTRVELEISEQRRASNLKEMSNVVFCIITSRFIIIFILYYHLLQRTIKKNMWYELIL